MPRSRSVREDKQQCGKRALAVAAALRRAKPDFPKSWPAPSEVAAKTAWERAVIEVMKAFDATNVEFPKKHFLTMCGFVNSLV